jgi:myo-inositol 2-dehydrogenase/D-chiro-inositol 1-dehydrogenase
MTVRLGFIGAGNHASQNLYPVLRYGDCRLVAVADLWEERRVKAGQAYGPEATYDDYRKLLERDDLDAVAVSGPASLHQEAGLAALERGLPVFLEKPPAPDVAGTRQLRDAAAKQGVICMVGFMKRYAQKYRKTVEIAARPEFGRKTHLFVRYSHAAGGDDPFRMLTLMTIHPIDLVRYFMGDPVSVQWELGGPGEAKNLAAHFRFADNSTATLISNNQAPAALERIELTGERAMVVVDEMTKLMYYPRHNDGAWRAPWGEVWSPNTALQTKENDSHVLQGYAGEIEAFLEAVATGTPPADGTIDDGVAAMRLCELIASKPRGEAEVPHD